MNDQDRLLDLLASRATEGLSDQESKELERALPGFSDIGAEDLELAAAAADLAFEAMAADVEPMPEEVKWRILEQARTQTSSSPMERHDWQPTVTPLRRSEMRDRKIGSPGKSGIFGAQYLGWYAAAAMLVLAVWAPWSRTPETTPVPAPTPEPTLAEQRSELMQHAGDMIQVAWATPEIEEYKQVTGDVVWSTGRQSGFMRLRGLPANQRSVEQYQLWIVDPTRDEKPIDGGVFDIPAGADEVIVPIDAKLRADAPAVFAITLEKPGGVVVSDGPLLVIAAVEA